jgi:hypothetical protein
MKRTAWIIRVTKTPEGKWRALKPVWSKRSGKPLLTQRALYKGAAIETPGGHWEIEWYEGGKRQRRRTGSHTADAVKALAKQKLKLQAMDAGIELANAEPANGKRPLRQTVDEFLAERKRTKAHKTWLAQKQVLDLFVRICPRRYVEDIKRADVMDKFVERLLFEFFLYTGAREGEDMHAEWADLLQDGQILLVREKKQWGFKPKGRKERGTADWSACP